MKKISNNLMMKLTLLTSLLVMIVCIGIGGISYYWSSQAVTEEVESKLRIELEAVKRSFEVRRENVEDVLGIIAETPTISSVSSKELMNAGEQNKRIKELLSDFSERNEELIEAIFITDAEGIIRADGNDGAYLNLNVSDREYFVTATNGKSNWSDIIESKGTGLPAQVYAYPIKSDNGTQIGVMAAAVKMDYFFQELKNLKNGNNGYAYMVDQKGLLLYHPNEDYMMKKTITEFPIPELLNAFEDMKKGNSGEVIYTYDGITKLNMYIGFEDYSISLNADQSEYLSGLHRMRNQTILFGIIFFAIGIAIAVYMSRNIVMRIRKMEEVMQIASEGNLTVEFTNDKGERPTDGDEVVRMGMSLNKMIDAFKELIIEIVKSTEIMSASSEELASASEESSQASDEVSSNVEEITAGSEEQANRVMETKEIVGSMKIQLKNSISATTQMVDESSNVLKSAEEGHEQMQDTLKQMNAIKLSSEHTIEVINSLNDQSGQIGNITETISGIADQTNLLALNASIEAARAGDQGRGFAVVAEEIRKLATESMASATGISQLINSIQSEITMATALINAENEAINVGLKTLNMTSEKFNLISERVDVTNALIGRVSDSISETNGYGEHVEKSVEVVQNIAQETMSSSQSVSASAEEQNAVAEEIASSAEQLSNLSMELLASVKTFKV